MSSTLLDLDAYKTELYANTFVPSPSQASIASMNTDGSMGMYGGQSMTSPLSSNMSPMSQTSDSSGASYFQNLNITNTNDYMSYGSPNNDKQPYLTIVEEPVTKFRFRYKSEMHGTHGSLTGQTTSRTKKTFPSVHLHNYFGEALIRCTLYQIQKPGHEFPCPHSHSLVIRTGNEDKKDPHVQTVSPSHGYSAIFQGMGIIHTARRYIEEELLAKLVAEMEFRESRALTVLEMERLKLKAKKESTDMNLNQVSLCFEAFEKRNGSWIEICSPVYSLPINNMKCALTGELKITRLSSVVSSVCGNEDLFLFVEKVGKKNIKVRFYEADEYENVLWEDWGRFSEADVHHQYAIALKTPPYRSKDIEKSIKVYIQLYRPSDDSFSEPVEFRYKPTHNISNSRKRPRIGSTYCSTEIPATVNERNFYDENRQPQCTISAEFDTQKIIQSVLTAADSTTNQYSSVPTEQYNSFHMLTGNLNSAELADIFNPLLDMELDKLATDSAKNSNLPSASSSQLQQEKLTQTLSQHERFLLQMLKTLWPKFIQYNNETDDRQKEKIQHFMEDIFRQAYYNGESLLHIALKSDSNGFMQKIWEIIHKFRMYDVLRLQNDNGENCIHVAAALGKADEIRNFIHHGVEVNAVDQKGDTPLHIAITENQLSSVDALLDSQSIDIGILNDNGYSPLHLAVKGNNLNVVEQLKTKASFSTNSNKSGDIFKCVESKHGNNALHIAVESSAKQIIKYILENRLVDVNATNLSNHSALVLARAMKDSEMIQMLMDNNAEAVTDEEDDVSPLISGESRASDDSNKSDSKKKLKVSNKMTSKSDIQVEKGKFDNAILQQLADIFNENSKWQSVADKLGYHMHISQWSKTRNPTKNLFVFSEAVKLPKDDIIKAFKDLNETVALSRMIEWKARNNI